MNWGLQFDWVIVWKPWAGMFSSLFLHSSSIMDLLLMSFNLLQPCLPYLTHYQSLSHSPKPHSYFAVSVSSTSHHLEGQLSWIGQKAKTLLLWNREQSLYSKMDWDLPQEVMVWNRHLSRYQSQEVQNSCYFSSWYPANQCYHTSTDLVHTSQLHSIEEVQQI